MTVLSIMNRVESMIALHPGSQLVITGGEPLEQNLVELVGSAKQNGMYVAVETNGIQAQELAVDWWAVSPKRERAYFIHSGLLGRVNEIKLVATPALTVDDILGIRKHVPGVPIFLQPDVYTQGEKAFTQVFELFERACRIGVEELRAGVQLHRIYKVP